MTVPSDYREESMEEHIAKTIAFIITCILALGIVVGVWYGGICLINMYGSVIFEQLNLIKNLFL